MTSPDTTYLVLSLMWSWAGWGAGLLLGIPIGVIRNAMYRRRSGSTRQ